MNKIDLPLSALRLIAALEEHQTLAQAATHVDLSQSAASHAIAMLEKRLDATLVVHGPGGLRLSVTGLRLLPHIKQITGSLEAIRDEVSGLAALARGTLRIAAVPSLASTFVPRMIRQFHAAYPAIDVSLFEGTDDEVSQWVRDRVADVGFAALPVDGLHGEEITRDEWLAVVPAADFEGRARLSLRTLSKRKFLLSGGGCEMHIRQLFRDAGMELPVHLSVKSMATIHTMVAEGLGVSLLPELALRSAPKGLRSMRLSPRRYRTIGLLTVSATRQSPAVEAWSEIARGFFNSKNLR